MKEETHKESNASPWHRNFTLKEEADIQKYIKNSGIPISYKKNNAHEVVLSFEYKGSISQFKIEKTLFDHKFYLKNVSDNSFILNFNDFDKAFNSWIKQLHFDFNSIFIDRNNEVEKISKRFYPVFEEAIIINRLGFEDSSAMIFRKAVEILFKDFLLQSIPEFENKIMKMTVGGLVYYFYTKELIVREKFSEHKIKLDTIKPLINFINQTFKIGNDFSHYERKLENLSAKSIEDNLNKILLHISYDVMLENLKNDKSLREDDMMNYKVSE